MSRTLAEQDPNSDREESRSMVRAAVFLINKGLKDKVFAVSSVPVRFWQYFNNNVVEPADGGWGGGGAPGR